MAKTRMDDKGGVEFGMGGVEWRHASDGPRHSQLFVLKTVPHFFRDPSKVPQTDLAGIVVIK